MAESEKRSFVVREEWIALFIGLSDENAGKLIKAICRHKLGETAQLEDETIKAIFNMCQQTLDNDDVKYKAICEQRKEYGRRGGKQTQAKAKQNQANACLGQANSSKSKQVQADNDNEYDNDNGLSKDNTIETIQDIFNSTCIFLPPCKAITKKRAELISETLEAFTIEDVKKVFEKANKADFLNGKNERGWKASFDWLIDINHFARVLEGAYDNQEKKLDSIHTSYDWDEINRELGIGS